MEGRYDTVLVLLSVATAVGASFVALDMASRVAAAPRASRAARLWLACGALAMGTGIWAMHFVGMLAFSLSVPLAYEIRITLASWLVAVLSSALALHTVSQPRLGGWRLVGAGTLMGLGIAAMHYIGMEALQMRPRIQYDQALFALSVLVAVAASTAALRICFLLRHETVITGLRKKAASSVVMGLAIVGMHYTGMAAASFAEGSVCGAGAFAIGGSWLGFTVSGLAGLFLFTTLLGSVYGAMPPTIRSRLVFLVVAAILPVALVAVVVMVYGYQRLQDQQTRDTIGTARAIVATVDKDLAGVESGLRVLSTSRLLHSDDLPAFHVQVQDVLRHLHVAAIQLEDHNGTPLLDSRQPLEGTQAQADGPGAAVTLTPTVTAASDRALLQRAPSSGPPIVGLSAGEAPVLTVSVPVPSQGAGDARGGWALRARLAPERLLELLRQQHLDPAWIVSIYDRGGIVVARSHEMPRFLGAPGAPQILQRLAQVDEDAVDAVTLEGIPVLSAFSRSPGTGWAVSISIPRSRLSAPLATTMVWLVGGLGLMLAASLLLAWRIGGSIAASVQGLTQPALALGSGAPVVVPPLGLTEADEVGRALTQAAQLLHAAKHDAHHDPLTGLANRTLFREMVQQQLVQAHRIGGGVSVLYVDLDGFKIVNDNHGHALGDGLLQQVAQRLLQGVRAGDLVARLGGDEFAVALIQPGEHGAAKVASHLVESLSAPYIVDGLSLHISASIGGASYGRHTPAAPDSCETLLHAADAAMYRAKASGKRRFVIAS